MLPKFLSLIDLAHDWPRRKQFGGLLNAFGGVVGETLFSTLARARCSCCGTPGLSSPTSPASAWAGPPKNAPPTAPTGFTRRNGTGVTRLSGWSGAGSPGSWTRSVFWWFTPVLAGMVLSVPLSVLTSRRSLGAWAKAVGLFLTPEETAPPLELVSLRSRMKIHDLTAEESPRFRTHAGLANAVLDPYVNAVHVSLLREKQLNPVYAEHIQTHRRRHRRGARAGGKAAGGGTRTSSSRPSAWSCWPIKRSWSGCIGRPGCARRKNSPRGGRP